jgi:hypothetical protein
LLDAATKKHFVKEIIMDDKMINEIDNIIKEVIA